MVDVAQALEEFEQHLDDAERHAVQYAKQYAEAMVSGKRTPPAPAGLHPLMAKLVRELVLDQRARSRRGLSVAA